MHGMRTGTAEQYLLIQRLLAAGDFGSAALACKSLTGAHPEFAPGWASGALVALALGNPRKAIEYADRALALAPDDARFLVLKARALHAGGAHAEATRIAAAAASRCGSDAAAHQALGSFYTATGSFEAALNSFTRAVELEPTASIHRFNRAAALRIVGRLEEAEREYDQVIADDPRDWEAYYNRADLRRQTPDRNHVLELETLAAHGFSHPRAEVLVRYALAKELEDLAEYSRSFAHLRSAAQLRRRHIVYDVERDVATVTWIEAAFTPQRLRTAAPGDPSTEPIFIVGMPRTGTTMVERILGRHPQVFAAGELPHFADALTAAATAARSAQSLSRRDLIEASSQIDFEALGSDYLARTRPATGHTPRFTDKLPLNYLYCGLIHLSLPNARIVHLTRHPMATCYAIYKTLFKDAYPFSYDLRELACYYAAYRRLMRHWHAALPGIILDVSYESLVNDPQAESKRLLAHCGLAWDPICADFHRNPNPTATASAAQVRRPLYDTSVRLWTHYERELEPLRTLLIEAGIAARELEA